MSSPFRKLKIKRTSNLSYLPILLAPTASSAGLSGGVTLSGSQLYTLPPWSTATLLCFSLSLKCIKMWVTVCACVCACERVSEINGGRRRQLYLVAEPKERGGARPLYSLYVSFVHTWFSYDLSPQTVQFAQFIVQTFRYPFHCLPLNFRTWHLFFHSIHTDFPLLINTT